MQKSCISSTYRLPLDYYKIKNRLLKRGDNKDEADRRMKVDNVDFRGVEMLANRIIYNNEGKELSDVVNEVLKWGD